MLFQNLALYAALAQAWPRSDNGPHNDRPESAAVTEALSNPDLYEQLVLNQQSHNGGEQSVFEVLDQGDNDSSTCGVRPSCPAFDGERQKLNGREYRLYCYNAPWGSYLWLPKSKTLEECENRCHQHQYDCNGLTFYPTTGACSIVHSKDAAPYIWNNGYPKIGAIPVKSDMAFGPGMICPLPGSDNQVWDFDGTKSKFKISCKNSFRVPATARRQVGVTKTVDECAERCGREKNCNGFMYYQSAFPGGRLDGARSCDLVMDKIHQGDFVPMYQPNHYLSGLRVEKSDCGDIGWNHDEEGRHRKNRDGDQNEL